jgi:hypothetical protein
MLFLEAPALFEATKPIRPAKRFLTEKRASRSRRHGTFLGRHIVMLVCNHLLA